MRLPALAIASALVYALWVVWVPLLPDNLATPLLDLGKITGYTPQAAALYLSLVVALYALYVVGARQAQEARARLLTIVAASAVFCAVLLFAYPATAVDVFAYIADGRLLAAHRANPFVTAPNEFASDAILKYLAYPGEPSQYGPLWVLLSGGIALLAQGDLLTEVMLYKVLGALAHLASGVLVYRIALHLSRDQQAARASALLFLWNPLLLWEMVANAHNDGLMMLGGLVAVWLLVTRRNVFVLPALAAGALIKLPVIALAPVLLIFVWRRTWTAALEGALMAAALAVVVYRPFWSGPETLTALRRTDLFTASFASVLRLGLDPLIGLDDATSVARALSLSIFVVVAVLGVVVSLRADKLTTILQVAYLTLLAGMLFGTTWFQAWYIVWPFALAAPLADLRRQLELVLLSLGGLLQYLVFIYLWVMGVWPLDENIGVQSAAYAAVVGPLILGSLAYAARRPSRPTRPGSPRRTVLPCKPS